jgi:hypothetical protein
MIPDPLPDREEEEPEQENHFPDSLLGQGAILRSEERESSQWIFAKHQGPWISRRGSKPWFVGTPKKLSTWDSRFRIAGYIHYVPWIVECIELNGLVDS